MAKLVNPKHLYFQNALNITEYRLPSLPLPGLKRTTRIAGPKPLHAVKNLDRDADKFYMDT